jgi:hypothetical protein
MNAFRADDAREELPCRVLSQRAQVQVSCLTEVAEPLPDGQQNHAARPAGNERSDLIAARGVIEHDQHPASGKQAPVQGSPFLGIVGQRFLSEPELPQETAEDVMRVQRFRGHAAEVDEQLAVRELAPGQVRDVDGQGGLAYPAHSADGGDDNRPRSASLRQQRQDPVRTHQRCRPDVGGHEGIADGTGRRPENARILPTRLKWDDTLTMQELSEK